MVDGGQEPLPEEPQLVEEEFDLSDIMGEQLEAQVGTKEDRLRQLEEQVLPFPSLPFPFLNPRLPLLIWYQVIRSSLGISFIWHAGRITTYPLISPLPPALVLILALTQAKLTQASLIKGLLAWYNG